MEIKVFGTNEHPYFRGKDIANILEYENTAKALRDHVRDKNKKSLKELIDIYDMKSQFILKGNVGATVYLNEAGVYQLIFKSKMKQAELFQDWVLEEVLPSIRKNGSYKLQLQLEEKNKLLLESQEIINQEREKIKIKDSEILSLQTASKNRVTFGERDKSNECLYAGAHATEFKQSIIKFGYSENIPRRTKEHSCSSSGLNDFEAIGKYSTYPDIALPVEKYIHAILEPTMVKVNPKRREHFLINFKFMDILIKQILGDVDKHVKMVNYYTNLLKKNNYNFYIMDTILENKINNNELNFEMNAYGSENDSNIPDSNESNIESEENNIESNNIESEESPFLLSNENISNMKKCKHCSKTKNNYKFDVTSVSRNMRRTNCMDCVNDHMSFNCKDCKERKPGKEFYLTTSSVRVFVCTACKEKTKKISKK
jgi:prophage antirepressor-like protein